MLQQVEQYSLYILLILTALLMFSLIIQIVMWAKIKKLKKNYQRLTRGINVKSIEELVLVFTDRVEQINKDLNQLKKEQEQLSQQMKTCIKTPKILKYNAFEDMGSNLSFSMALLDNEYNGLILTSIYGRDESRFYAKRINKGKSEQNLSPEEKIILEEYKIP
ncbi:uncharacterized protein YlxW (UPF0749 family) [Desulfohalotomaculum tongense]|uniref:DUF4446 family protein n=1 Tax=Desulforadius tongensis TaxID=1216062 RepID=UPI00195B2799|nr:DUF4446 family protein [Desulforadius tongensis]MBM7855808.1 uncharacterized protein YlxW (UPF0749 family) [Desulforadius tongensis]